MILPLLTQFPPVQVGALATQIMEFFHCFADEVEYIWQFVKRLSPTSSFNRSIHPAVGYFSSPTYTHGRATSPSSRRCKKPHHNFAPPTPHHHHHHSSVNLVFMEIAQSPSADDHTCLMGFITIAVTAQIATTCIELILLVRGKPSHFQPMHIDAKSI